MTKSFNNNLSIGLYLPHKGKETTELRTSGNLVDQLWQEFEMLRHLNSVTHLSDVKEIAPWIDQAKIYFQDGVKSDWRSAGLLYYYSFLNLAKAYLVAKNRFTFASLDTTSIYHGLKADLQPVNQIIDYKIAIYPPTSKGKGGIRVSNVFSHFYEIVIGETWPFSKEIEVKVSDYLAYSYDIASELNNIYGLSRSVFPVQSLFRKEADELFFEMLVEDLGTTIIQKQIFSIPLEILSLGQLSDKDKECWKLGFGHTPHIFVNHKLLRTRSVKETEYSSFCSEIDIAFEKYAFPPPTIINNFLHWEFIPEIVLGGKSLKWHPILSEYLFSFVLGTILRYQPQLLKPQSPESFLASAWCKQSSITALRHFLMLFTKPSIVMTLR
jgi:YaaC-like Protein